MPKGSPNDFGRYLQACRLASGQSLIEIARQTKIIRSCLHQIENEEMQKLPEAVFVKGFLRAYADAVGGDAEEALRRYQNRCGIQQQIERGGQVTASGTRFWLRFMLVLLLFAGTVGLTLYVVEKVNSDDNIKSRAGQTSAPPHKGIHPRGSVVAARKAGFEESTDPSSELILSASAVDHTRLKIIIDAGLPKKFELQPGEKIAVSAEKQFNLLISNAGGIRLSLNDKPVSVPGQSGQVVTLNLP